MSEESRSPYEKLYFWPVQGAVCECGHADFKHDLNTRCTHQDIKEDPPYIHVNPCGCKKFKPMDWITDFCIIPEKMVDK